MLTTEANERLTQVGPGTPMGELMRRYWHPIAATAQLPERGTRPVRLLGEDLVLFRDRSGQLGLIADRCPHRRAGLIYGIPEEEGLRCAYHGWLWAADGRCLEQPYEETEDPAGPFRDRVRVTSYPASEAKGMIFAYLGPEPAPALPPYDLLVWEEGMRDIGVAVVPCNWVQIMENSLDPIHVEWLHWYFSAYVLDRLGRPDLDRGLAQGGTLAFKHSKIGFDLFDHGIIKRRLLHGMTEEDDGWAVGHPIIFPNILRTGNTFQIRVPIDDTHTLHWWYSCHRGRGVETRPQDTVPLYEVPVPGLAPNGEPDWPLLDNNSGQDLAMWYTQGGVANRSLENLGLSDKGVNLYRRLLESNLAKALRGEDPMNVFRDVAADTCIEFQVEQELWSTGGRERVARTGQASKYSPVLREAAHRVEGEQTLLEPVH